MAPTSGIVRHARRPPGWLAPGPRPAAPADGPGPGEDLCYLAGDFRIFQRVDGHRWSLDDLVTAWFAAHVVARPPEHVADLGCGIGAVLMLIAWRFPASRGVGVEAQAMSIALARRSVAWNGLAQRCAVRHGDLRDPSIFPEGAAFDLVTGTPPYLPRGTATESLRPQRAGCHVEHLGGIEAYAAVAAVLLVPGGRFVTCAAAGQRDRVDAAARAAGLAVERRIDIVPRDGKPALFSVHSMRRAAECANRMVDPPLVVRDRSGRRTPTFHALRHTMGMPP